MKSRFRIYAKYRGNPIGHNKAVRIKAKYKRTGNNQR